MMIVKIPYELKDEFRRSFKSAKWMPEQKGWKIGKRSESKYWAWHKEFEEAIKASEEINELQLEANAKQRASKKLAEMKKEIQCLKEVVSRLDLKNVSERGYTFTNYGEKIILSVVVDPKKHIRPPKEWHLGLKYLFQHIASESDYICKDTDEEEIYELLWQLSRNSICYYGEEQVYEAYLYALTSEDFHLCVKTIKEKLLGKYRSKVKKNRKG